MLHEQWQRLNAKPRERHHRVTDDLRKNGPLQENYYDLLDDLVIRASSGALRFSDPASTFSNFAPRMGVGR